MHDLTLLVAIHQTDVAATLQSSCGMYSLHIATSSQSILVFSTIYTSFTFFSSNICASMLIHFQAHYALLHQLTYLSLAHTHLHYSCSLLKHLSHYIIMYFSMKLVSCVLLFGGFVAADCATNAQEVDGNWYCSAVKKITYNNFGTSGQYNQVIDMADDGTCTSVPKAFSGPLSPLNEQVRY